MRQFILLLLVCYDGVLAQTSTAAPSTSAAPIRSKKSSESRECVKSPWCYCDLSNFCEVGCCCDPDCEQTVSGAFKNECPCDLPNEYLVPYCSKSDILVSNQTHLIKRPIGQMMCIVDDHVYKKDSYTDGKTLSADQFHEKLKHLKLMGEFVSDDEGHEVSHEAGFTEGQNVKIRTKQGVIQNFAIPSAVGSNVCDNYAAVHYMNAKSSKCYIEYSCDSPFSRMQTFTDINFISSSASSIAPLAYLCLPNKDCDPHSTQDLTDCSYFSKVEYRIVHNGTIGIQDVYVFVYRDDSIPEKKQLVPLQVDVFFETKQDATIRQNGGLTKRSGNPGYIVGKPVLVRNGESTTRPLSAPFKDCTDIDGGAVVFGENLQSKCKFSTCDELRENLLTMLTGDSPGYIGVYGSSDTSVVDDWIMVDENTIEVNKSCSFKVDVVIAFMRTQFKINPQNRIVYTQVRYSPLLYKQPLVETTVSFVDMSASSQVRFASPPIIDIKLPDDFFYPLRANFASSRSVNWQLILLSFLCIHLISKCN